MNKPNANWIRACFEKEIPKRGAIRIQHGAMKIAIFKTASDAIFALEDKCPHKGGPLSAGIVHDNCVTCPLHNWDISLESGHALGADKGHTASFPVSLENGVVLLSIEGSQCNATA